MLANLFIFATAGAILLAAIRSQPVGGEDGLCWSCGQRGLHKLWCPNR